MALFRRNGMDGASTLLVVLLLMLFGGASQAGNTCATVNASLDVNIPCVGVGGQFYQVALDAYSNQFDPAGYYWSLGPVGQTTDNGNCASFDGGNMAVSLPCVSVNGFDYSASLNHYANKADPFGLYRSLGDVQISLLGPWYSTTRHLYGICEAKLVQTLSNATFEHLWYAKTTTDWIPFMGTRGSQDTLASTIIPQGNTIIVREDRNQDGDYEDEFETIRFSREAPDDATITGRL